jgi:hypothetical protein
MHLNAITDEQDRVTHYIGIVSDLTERKLQEQRLILFRKLRYADRLTQPFLL